MKKKHELIKHAYDNYPKGTIGSWGGDPIVLTGKYNFNDDYIIDSDAMTVFDGLNWASIIPEQPKSILDGKCAITVNNEREFKLLIEHYESKGWKTYSRKTPNNGSLYELMTKYSSLVSYGDRFVFPNTESDTAINSKDKEYELFNSDFYKIIPFQDFAKEANIKVPVFIMKSEDGQSLYEGDKYYRAEFIKGKWELSYFRGEIYTGLTEKTDYVVHSPEESKAFSTKESAEKWILENNKPQLKQLKFGILKVNVALNGICIYPNTSAHCHLSSQELEEIYTAYKSLQ